MNPYESPSTTQETKEVEQKFVPERSVTIREYFSFSGSFSRTELLIATIVIGGLFFMRSQLLGVVPDGVFLWILALLPFILYPLWGVALGKRSRDLGTTFTYGMLVGMLFPIIGIIFLFQEGAKFKASKNR